MIKTENGRCWAECDAPGCGERTVWKWGEGTITDYITELGWAKTRFDEKHFCPEHRSQAHEYDEQVYAAARRAKDNAVEIDADELAKLRDERDRLTRLCAEKDAAGLALAARAQELLESNTRLLEERRAVDIHYNVEQFHRARGNNDPREPCVPPDDVVRFRMRLVAEEFLELLEAAFDCRGSYPLRTMFREIVDHAPVRVDLPAWSDASEDLDYVVEGSRQEFGVDGRPLLRAVQAANMAKFGPGSSKRPDGKQNKPEGWQPPDIAGELRKQGWRGP